MQRSGHPNQCQLAMALFVQEQGGMPVSVSEGCRIDVLGPPWSIFCRRYAQLLSGSKVDEPGLSLLFRALNGGASEKRLLNCLVGLQESSGAT